MKVKIEAILNDPNISTHQASSQRQLQISVNVIPQETESYLPLNLCLVLDYSGSMRSNPMARVTQANDSCIPIPESNPLEKVKEASLEIISKLNSEDRLAVVAFNHKARVIIANQSPEDIISIEREIRALKAEGGTAIDEGLKAGMQEIINGKQNRVSQIFLLTDGENEHGDNQKCLKLAELAAEYNITINTLGFGSHWNPDVLEKIADRASGTLCHIEEPEAATKEFERLFNRVQSVNLTNAHLLLKLNPEARLAEFKPLAQVSPETIELEIKENQIDQDLYLTRLGDLSKDVPKVILANLYLYRLPPGETTIAQVQLRYDDPIAGKQKLLSEKISVVAIVQENYQPAPELTVTKSILTLAKYRQTQLAEQKLEQGDRAGAATLLQTAAKTALQLGDKGAATVLQDNATKLQAGEELSDAERKKTRMVSKTVIKHLSI
ncbi:VWA domain-containing protein [Gloeocapsa sp. PCC 73106]|uniref:vWA domain-containing protein n=1 Tax=Gloeocapsa sp. PCC 73106 TaxID=102232 RepID=UPI0002ACDCD4|nr:VWA domain-containing protein [Gloeocapsa sp. PCC 73106]ELR98659.1 uncharacterized protein containing a von Willebrand factor type A (vWA) domain [Gloeocapsa sp. PCC 73106]